MRKWRIPFAQPDIGEHELKAVEEVLRSGWLTQGPVCEDFEKRFADKIGVKHAVFVSSATAALHLAHSVLGIREGDEVICPALSFVATANASRYVGARPVFSQICSLNEPTLDPEDICRLITPRTRAISVVHFAGFPARIGEISELAELNNLLIIEDCAHSPGAWCEISTERRFVGSIGKVGCFSFFGNKNMTTGEGGMLTTNDALLADKARQLRSHGMTSRTTDRQVSGSIKYDVQGLGYNYRSTEIAAAIGSVQLQRLDDFNRKRRILYAEYIRCLDGVEGIHVPFTGRNLESASPHIMPVYLETSGSAGRIQKGLNEAGVQVSRHYDLIPTFSAFSGDEPFNNRVDGLEHTLTLPLYPSLSLDSVHEICSLIVSILKKAG